MKSLFATNVLIILVSYSFAQGISGGVKAGLNLANQKFSNDGTTADTKVKPGLNVGLFLTAMISEKFAIQPEVLFSTQGCKMDFDGYEYQTNFNYLVIPVLARYNIADRISIHAGPQFGFILLAETEIGGTKNDIKEDFKKPDIGGAVGSEINIVAGLGAGVRYAFGLSNIHVGGVDDNGKAKNSVFQIYLKYTLFGGKQ